MSILIFYFFDVFYDTKFSTSKQGYKLKNRTLFA